MHGDRELKSMWKGQGEHKLSSLQEKNNQYCILTVPSPSSKYLHSPKVGRAAVMITM